MLFYYKIKPLTVDLMSHAVEMFIVKFPWIQTSFVVVNSALNDSKFWFMLDMKAMGFILSSYRMKGMILQWCAVDAQLDLWNFFFIISFHQLISV